MPRSRGPEERPHESLPHGALVVERLDPGPAAGFARKVAAMEAITGLKLGRQIVAPLGDSWRIFDSPSESRTLLGVAAVVSLKDPSGPRPRRPGCWNYGKGHKRQRRNQRTKATVHPAATGCLGGSSRSSFPAARYVVEGGARDFPFAPAWCLTDKELVVALGCRASRPIFRARLISNRLAQMPDVSKAMRDNAGLRA